MGNVSTRISEGSEDEEPNITSTTFAYVPVTITLPTAATSIRRELYYRAESAVYLRQMISSAAVDVAKKSNVDNRATPVEVRYFARKLNR